MAVQGGLAAVKPASYLIEGLRRLVHLGAHAAQDEGESRRILLANRFALSYLFLTAPYFFVFMACGMWALAWGVIPMLAWHAATLALNAKGHATAARVSLSANAMVSILITAIALGRTSGAHNLLLAASLNFLILFDWGKEKRFMIWGLVANSALYLGYQLLGSRQGLLYVPPPLLEKLIRAALSMANLLGIIAGVGHFLVGSARAEKALIAAREKAQAADRIKCRFIANMSHEIRTPLNVILGLARLMENPEAESQRRGFLADIRASAADLLEILNDALDLSKIEAGKIDLECKPFRLGDLAEAILVPFRMQAIQKGLDLRLEADAANARVLLGDPLRLRQVLNNLLSNAFKFTPKGSVILRVARAGGTVETPAYRFEVADTGIGIAAEAQGQLFQSFRQADDSITRTHGGTGLGLAICKGLVEMMGGTIQLESRPGLGTTVHFTASFRLGREENIRPSGDAEPRPPEPAAAGKMVRSARILVVDDHPMNRMVLRILLEAQGFLAEEVADGEGALRACAERPYDLIFMDYHMPVMNGLECTKRIRDLRGAQPVIVGITADALPDSRATCLEAGMDRLILKPVEAADLRSVLSPWTSFPEEAVPLRPGSPASEWVDIERLGNLVHRTRLRDPDYRNKAWEQFRSDTETLRQSLREAGRSGNARELKDAAHGLKGLCMTMGLNRLADACRRIEVVSQESGRSDWSPALSDLEAAYDPSLADLARALETRFDARLSPPIA
jgi:signal transduction histidine kinase/HPt (histidine-containing phosphotransfer) domain-containing protein